MLVIVKDKDGNEVATFEDVAKIVIDTSVTTGLVYVVSNWQSDKAACSVTMDYGANDIMQGSMDTPTP